MIIILAGYAILVWLLFFRFKLLPWTTFTKILVSVVGLAILLTFMGLLNTRTPSGRVTVMSPVVSISPVISGTVAEVHVQSYQEVREGDVLVSFDKRPFEYAVAQAEAQKELAEVSYLRIKTAIEKNPATYSRQQRDEAQASFDAATAALDAAQYNLDRTEIVALADGQVSTTQVRVGDRIAAYVPFMAMMRNDEERLWAVFQQNGFGAVAPGYDVGIAFSNEPGVVHWTKVLMIAPGSGGGQVPNGPNLLTQSNIGSTTELIAILDWPEGLDRGAVTIGTTGAATVVGPDAGPIGGLGRLLLMVKSYANYL